MPDWGRIRQRDRDVVDEARRSAQDHDSDGPPPSPPSPLGNLRFGRPTHTNPGPHAHAHPPPHHHHLHHHNRNHHRQHAHAHAHLQHAGSPPTSPTTPNQRAHAAQLASDAPRPERAVPPPANPGVDPLIVFRAQPLAASGDFYFKVSRLQRSRRHYAELRGATIVVFRAAAAATAQLPPDGPCGHEQQAQHQEQDQQQQQQQESQVEQQQHRLQLRGSRDMDGQRATMRVEDVMAVMPVHEYTVQVSAMREEGTARIYFSSARYADSMAMFARPSSAAQLHAWRTALACVTAAPLPSLSALTIESVIGRGGGGKVFVVNWGHDGRLYALKVIDKAVTFKASKSFRHVASERMLMERVGAHPFLLQMHFAFQSDSNLFIGTPFCPGGDLASYIRHKGQRTFPMGMDDVWVAQMPGGVRKLHGRLSEELTRRIIEEVVLGLEHLHRIGIVYRDLKPENIFIDGEGHIRIGDYGLAKLLSADNNRSGHSRTTSICGTRNYLPPEMLNGRRYSYEADVWSLGVMMYRMLCGVFPFDGRRTKDVFARIKRDRVRMPLWLSHEARQLLGGMLDKKPEARLTMEQVKRAAFFRDTQWDAVLRKQCGAVITDVEGGGSVHDALENFELSKLQGITVGEYVSGAGGGESGESVEGRAGSRAATHRKSPKGMMVGFEYTYVGEEGEGVQPLAVRQNTGGLLSKLASLEMEQLPFSPRSPFQGGGR